MKARLMMILILFQFATVLAMADEGINYKLCVSVAKDLTLLGAEIDHNALVIQDNFRADISRTHIPKNGRIELFHETLKYKKNIPLKGQISHQPSGLDITSDPQSKVIQSITVIYPNEQGYIDAAKKVNFEIIKNTCVPQDLKADISKPKFKNECTNYYLGGQKDEAQLTNAIHKHNCKLLITTNSQALFFNSTGSGPRHHFRFGTR